MKRIIELPNKVVEAIQNGEDYRYDIHTAIAQSTPYNPTGDCISKSALKAELEVYRHDETRYVSDEEEAQNALLDNILEDIDNAQAVPLPNEQVAWEQGYEAGLAQGKHERPQGEWIPKRLWDNTHIWVCSECGNPCKHGITIEKACWKCGADMKGGDDK